MRIERFFPLKEAKNKCQPKLTDIQESALNRVSAKLQNKEYSTVLNRCLCGDQKDNVVLADYDRFGLPFSFKLCKKCSLIRTDPILDQPSLTSYYKHEFSLMHRGSSTVTSDYFKRFLAQGEAFSALLKRLNIFEDVQNILEVGCSAGGNLYPLFLSGKNTIGYDYDTNYLKYGQDLGINLIEGDFYKNVPPESQDLVILSHVLEHFRNPVREVCKIIEKIKNHKYFLVEIPGVLHIGKSVYTPLNYFQNDHIFHFNKEYLTVFFTALGMDVIYSDDICRFVLKKPEEWIPRFDAVIYESSLDGHYITIQNYIFKSFLEDKIFPYKRVKRFVGNFLRKQGFFGTKIRQAPEKESQGISQSR